MRRFLSLFLLLSLIVRLQSCVMEQNYVINADNGGKYEMIIDMSGLSAMGGDSAINNAKSMSPESLEELKNGFNGMEGLSNSFASNEGGVMKMGFDFENIKNLNLKSKDIKNSETYAGLLRFKAKGNKMEIYLESKALAAGDTMSKESIASMDAMLTMKFKVKFERPIKKFKSKLATFDEATNTVSYQLSLGQIYDKKCDFKTRKVFK